MEDDPNNLGQLAAPLDEVLNAGGLHEEGVLPVALLHHIHSVRVGGHHHLSPVDA